MTVEPITVWSLPPDWTDGTLETIEFLSTVAESPSAIEQRRGLRLSPRQYFEYSYILEGPLRTYLDMLTMRASGSPVYVPMWHDVERLPYGHVAGSTALAISVIYTEFMNCDVIMLGGPHDYELVEIQDRADALVTLTGATIFDWPAGTRAVPVKKCRVDQQPATTRRSEVVHVARVKFCSLEPNRTDAENPLNTFGLQYVLEEDPNEVEDLTYTYDRLISTLDNTTGLPTMSDVTGRVLQQFSWWRRGRQEHHRLRGLFYALDGRRVPVWVPTIYRDFEPVTPIYAGDLAINVKRCGFTSLGGPGPQREYILIHARSGTRYYRKILGSTILGDGTTERLFIDAPLGTALQIDEIRRISFLVLCRLDGDSIEFHHHTATRGMTTTVAVFRSAAAKHDIESQFEVAPGDVLTVVCLDGFQWFVHTQSMSTNIRVQRVPRQLDQFGNYYEYYGGSQYNIYNPNGVLLNTYTTTQLWDAIDAHYGFNITGTSRQAGIVMNPLRQGKYVLAYGTTNTSPGNYDKWWALFEPQVDGSLVFIGAVRHRNLTGPPYVNGLNVMDVFDDDTIILIQTYGFVGSSYAVLQAVPTINDFKEGTFEGGAVPGLIHTTMLAPIGNVQNLSRYLFVLVPNNQNAGFGFRLPGNGRDVFYIYVNRHYMDYCASGGSFASIEIRNVIQPVYPLGAMLKIGLGDLSDFAELQATPLSPYYGRTTDTYTIDNDNWRDKDGGTTIPFEEEYTLLSTGEVGGADVFSSQVSTQKRTNGRFWVIFVMTGRDDSAARSVGLTYGMPVYARVRLFDYNPATEVAVQIGVHTCVLRDTGDGPNNSIEAGRHDLYLNAEVIETAETATIVLYGPVYRVSFCQFLIPEA
jgi:hypothetical protein